MRYLDVGVSKNRCTPKSSILIGFSIINHPFWGTPIFGNTHVATTGCSTQLVFEFDIVGLVRLCQLVTSGVLHGEVVRYPVVNWHDNEKPFHFNFHIFLLKRVTIYIPLWIYLRELCSHPFRKGLFLNSKHVRAFCRWDHQSHARKYTGSNADVGASLLVTSTCTFCSGGVVVELFVKKQIKTVLFDQVRSFLQFAKETDVVGGGGCLSTIKVLGSCAYTYKLQLVFLCGLWPCVHSSWWKSCRW